ncbi:transposase (plasmid) [Acinetobacter ursingii]|nr:transposase [Acinetobacter ursingii]UYF81092.1 transposase [Acinetobacter ursingii]
MIKSLFNTSVRAVQLTTNNVSASQVLDHLLAQTPKDERVDFVYIDGAYDTKQFRQVIVDRQAQAVIPPRKMRSHGKRWPR